MTECQCEGSCVCAEIDSLLDDVSKTKVRSSALMLPEMFDIGVGESLSDGTNVLNIILHGPHGPSPDGEAMLRMSFPQESAHKMIACAIMAYNSLWGATDDE